MFFFKKKAAIADYGFLSVDMHNHILPGIDDGAPNIDSSLGLLIEFKKLGFTRVIPTPHTYTALYPNSKETIQLAFESLKASIKHNLEKIPALNSYASEYMIDDDFAEIRSKNNLLGFGGDRILIEMSFADSAPMLMDEIFQLQLMGYIPVLAHPERYPYLFGQVEYFEQLLSLGCELQLNLLSLTNHYGKGPQKTAIKLLEKNLYSWAGTDAHHMGHIELLQSLPNSSLFTKITKYPFKNRALASFPD